MSATVLSTPKACADAIIERVGKTLVVGTPLAAGKANHLLNALYARAKENPEIELTIMTALTLERPKPKTDLERRFLAPFVERVFGNYPDLDYELDRVAETLPDNVRVIEFYFAPAKFKDNARAQRDYISANYTHAARDLLDRGVNVLVQQIVDHPSKEGLVSVSCNPDLSADIIRVLRKRADDGEPVAIAGQTNGALPYMYGDAEMSVDQFDFIVRNPSFDYTLFPMPKMSVSETEHVIGLNIASLIKDGGELQVGIGALGDSVVSALLARHERNDDYRWALDTLELEERFGAVCERLGDDGPFEQGLFAASEMVVDGFLDLFQRGVIKRRVYDDVALQRLLNEGLITEEVTPDMLDRLVDVRAIAARLRPRDVEYLTHWGVFRPGVELVDGGLRLPDGKIVEPDLDDPRTKAAIAESGLGAHLAHGAVMHGGFFLGSPRFYQGLRDLSEAQRRMIRMRSVLRINQLYGHEEIDRLHRRHARFVNTCMMATLSGAAVSDGLEDGTVISGVGGQFNFVDMAQALPDGHSILNFRSTRTKGGVAMSNVVPKYGHITIPRHMRDIYVTEYGIAYVRGRTDEEIIEELLKITDSRFQDDLVREAKATGKLRPTYEVPEMFRRNLPEVLADRIAPLRAAGLLEPFPLGCDFTPEELRIGKALKDLKAKVDETGGGLRAVFGSLAPMAMAEHPEWAPLLARMDLEEPDSLEARVSRRLLVSALKETA